jgi:hypothetical protein
LPGRTGFVSGLNQSIAQLNRSIAGSNQFDRGIKPIHRRIELAFVRARTGATNIAKQFDSRVDGMDNCAGLRNPFTTEHTEHTEKTF